MTKNKSWTLTPTHTLTLAPPNKRGECQKCELEKTIWLIAETALEYRKLCWSCSLDNLWKLETGNYPVKNKEQIIKQIRAAFIERSRDEEQTEPIQKKLAPRFLLEKEWRKSVKLWIKIIDTKNIY